MKRKYLILFCIAVVSLGTLTAFRLFPHTLPDKKCSVLYQKFVTYDGIRATYIKNKKVNDSVMLDVTMLEAVTDSGWTTLMKEFNLTPPPAEVLSFTRKDALFVFTVSKNKYSVSNDNTTATKDVASVSWSDRIINIFHIKDSSQNKAVHFSLFDEGINNQSNNSKNE